MSHLLLMEAITDKLKDNTDLVAALPVDTGKQYIGQYLKDVKDRSPYVSIQITGSTPVSPTVTIVHRTGVTLRVHSRSELLTMNLTDILVESITDPVNDYWDVSNGTIANVWTQYLASYTEEDYDFEHNSDIHVRAIDIQLTWRLDCEANGIVDIEEPDPVSDPRDPAGETC